MTFEEFIDEWNNDEPYIVVKTSGSTGEPKEINLLKEFVIKSAKRTNNYFGITKKSRLHSCVSPEFIGGKMMAVRSIISGASLTWENPSNETLKNLNHQESIDLLAMVPSQMLYVLENIEFMPQIGSIIIGGSAINSDLRARIVESNLNAFETYGMTETASHIALRKVSKEQIPFKTLPGINVDTDKRGCLKIIFDTGEIIQTNDLADLISETEFNIKGRKDNIIISGGKKINPAEIEERLSSHFNFPFCFTGLPDIKWGEKLVLLIEGERIQQEKEIRNILENHLERWQLPKELIFVRELPKTPNGKILRIKNLSQLSDDIIYRTE